MDLRLTLLPAIAALAAGLGLLLLAEPAAQRPVPIPATSGAWIEVAAAAMPQGEPPEGWWRDDGNPFVPWPVRQASAHPAPTAKAGSPAPEPPRAPRPDPPRPDYPETSGGGRTLPQPRGVLSAAGTTRVTFADGRTLALGASIDGHALEAVETGGVVVLRAADGRRYRLVVPAPAAPQAQSGSSAR